MQADAPQLHPPPLTTDPIFRSIVATDTSHDITHNERDHAEQKEEEREGGGRKRKRKKRKEEAEAESENEHEKS